MPSMKKASRPATGRVILFSIYYLLYQRKIQKTQVKLDKAKKDVQSATGKVDDAMRREKELAGRLESAREEVSKSERDLAEIDTIIWRLKSELLKLGVSQEELSLNNIYEIAELESANSLAAEDLKARLAKLQNDRTEIFNSYSNVSMELAALHAQYTSHKLQLEQLQSSSEGSGVSQQKDKIASRIKFLDQEYERADAEILAIEEETTKLEESKNQNSNLLQKLYQERESGASKIGNLISQIAALKTQKVETSAQIVGLGADLCSIKQKSDQQLSELADRRKALSLKNSEIQISSLLKLKDALSTKPIEGVFGLLLDVTSFPSKLQPAFQMLLGPKMFAFVVRDQEAADRLVRLNKQIQGGRILVYPLSWMEDSLTEHDEQDAANFKRGAIRNADFVYPKSDGVDRCIILETHLEASHPELLADKYFHRLLAFLLKGKLAVPDLEAANKLAKAYGCDCVTSIGEVVYAQGFLNKLGSPGDSINTLTEYLKYKDAQKNWLASTEELQRAQSQYEDLKTEELRLANEVQQLTFQKEKESSMLSRIWEEQTEYQRAVLMASQAIKELDERKNSLKSFLKEAKAETKKLSDEVAQLDKNPGKAMISNPSKLTELIGSVLEQISAGKHLILSKTSVQRDLQETITRLDREEYLLNEKMVLSEKLALNKEFRDKESSFLSKTSRRNEELVADLTKRLQLKEAQRVHLKSALTVAEGNFYDVEKKLIEKRKISREAQLELESLNQKRFDLQISTDTFEQKLQNLHIDMRDPEQKRAMTTLEHKKDIDLVSLLKELMIAKLRYTQKDKANFEQLERFFETHTDLQGELENLNEGKKVLTEVASRLL